MNGWAGPDMAPNRNRLFYRTFESVVINSRTFKEKLYLKKWVKVQWFMGTLIDLNGLSMRVVEDV